MAMFTRKHPAESLPAVDVTLEVGHFCHELYITQLSDLGKH